MRFEVWGLGFGFRVSRFGVWGLEFGVWSLGFGVWGLEFRDEGLSAATRWTPIKEKSGIIQALVHSIKALQVD